MPIAAGWLLTFSFLNCSWVFFRAEQWQDAVKILKAMFIPEASLMAEAVLFFGVASSASTGMPLHDLGHSPFVIATFITVLLGVVLYCKNSTELLFAFRPDLKWSFVVSLLFSVALIYIVRQSEFIYFRF
jgi:hypothetical protein